MGRKGLTCASFVMIFDGSTCCWQYLLRSSHASPADTIRCPEFPPHADTVVSDTPCRPPRTIASGFSRRTNLQWRTGQ